MFYENVFIGGYQQTNPDSLLFARELEQSILKGRILDTDNYASFPYKTKTGFAPFYMYFLVSFVNFVFFIFPNLQIDPLYVAGILPIIIVWLTSIGLIFSIYKLSNNKILTLFVALGMMPGFAVETVSGFLNIDYDYLISFFIWSWIFFGAFYIKRENNTYVYLGSVVTALFISTWNGSPFFYFFVTTYAFVLWLFNTKDNSSYLTYSSITMLIGSVVAMIFVPRNEETIKSFINCNVGRYSYIQGVFVFIGAIFIAFLNYIKKSKKTRLFGLSLLALVVIILTFLFHDTLFQASGIIFQKDPVHATIGELDYGVEFRNIYLDALKGFLFRFGPCLIFFPVSLLLFPSFSKQKEIKFILDWLLLFLVLSLFYQIRYYRWMGCGYGLIIGISSWCFWEMIKKFSVNLSHSFQRTAICILPFLWLGITVNYACIKIHTNLKKDEITLYNWIKDNTPETSGYSDDKDPEYGVLAYWDDGNKLSFYTKRPVVVSNSLWGYKTMACIFSSENEKEAYELCKKYGVRYTVIAPSRQVEDEKNSILRYWPLFKNMPETSEYKLYYGELPQRDSFDFFFFWLRDNMGLTPMGEFGNSSHFRLVFANENDGRTISKYFVFQTVKGAVCKFKALAGAKVSLSMEFNVGEIAFIYKSEKTANEDGVCEFVLPYSNGYDSGNITTDPFYKVSIEETDGQKRLAKLILTDSDVVNGHEVDLAKSLEYLE